MTADALIDELRRRDIRLSADGDRLKINAPAALLTADLLAILKAHKPELLAALAPKPKGCAWRYDEQGRLIFSDGAMYASTPTGGWVLVRAAMREFTRDELRE